MATKETSTQLFSIDASISQSQKKADKESQSVDLKMNLLQRLNRKIPACGFLLALFSCFFYVTITLMVKLTPNLNTIVMLTIRCVCQTIFYLLPILYQNESFMSDRDMNIMLIVRGFFSYACMVLNYASLRFIPFGDATSIMQSAPIYTSIIAYLWLGEKFTFLQVCCVLSSIVGVCLIAKPQIMWQIISGSSEASSALHSQTLKGTLYALSSAVALSACYVIVRKLQRVSVLVVLFWFSLGCSICGMIHLTYMRIFLDDLSVRLPEGTHEWICTVTSSLVGVVGQLMINVALKVEEAGPVSLARTGEILLSFTLQVLILHHEPLEWTSLLGAFIIFTAIVLSALRRWALDGSNPPKILIWLFRPERKDKKMESISSNVVVQVVQLDQKSKTTSN